MTRAVAILEVMWGMKAAEEAPRWFHINPRNHTGKRLYQWLGKPGERFNEILVTNACPELVPNAKGRGKPDTEWVNENLKQLAPFHLLLVCGSVARAVYPMRHTYGRGWKSRVIELPHPAARQWTKEGLARAGSYIRDSRLDLEMFFRGGRLVIQQLVPF
jgi:hypothetical protein